VRIVGSSANSCAHVACGRLTGYFEESGLIDWAVGVLLVQEAGGIVTDWWGRGPEFYEKTGAVIAANAATHAYLIDKLKSAPVKDPAEVEAGRQQCRRVNRSTFIRSQLSKTAPPGSSSVAKRRARGTMRSMVEGAATASARGVAPSTAFGGPPPP